MTKDTEENVVSFPKQEKADPLDFILGPVVVNHVVVEGRVIPGLTAQRNANGTVGLIIDGRMCVDFPPDIAKNAAWLLAQALAVGAGYTHSGAESKERSFAPQVAHIGPRNKE